MEKKSHWQRWKAKHWDEHLEGAISEPGWWSPGYLVAPPLRKLARWAHRNGWQLTAAAIGAVGAVAALIQALR